MLIVQTIGRGLHMAAGKDRLIILDHAGNHLRLGMVTDIHHERLDDGEPRKRKTEPGERSESLHRLCGECEAVVPRHAKRCPECDAVRITKTDVEMREGELVEFGSGARSAYQPSIADRAGFFGELRGHAREKGYADGWAAHKFKEKFGAWPNDPRIRNAVPLVPTLKTLSWIRSRQIVSAKGSRAYG
jgi:DNA repair protein RadD